MSIIQKSHKLSDIAKVIRGVTYGSDDGQDRQFENHLPVLRAGNIQDRLLFEKNLVWVPNTIISRDQLIKQHDIIMCSSSGSAAVVGKSARAESDWQGSFGAFCVGIRPEQKKCDPSYLSHYLRSPAFMNWSSLSAGANIKNIRKSELEEFEIPLPPLLEQKRIAAILDKADSIRRKRQEAVRLTEELLRSVFLEMFGDPVTNPKGWDTCCLGDVVQKIESGWSPVCEEGQAEENEWGVLKLGAVTTCRYLDTESKALPAGISPRPDLEVQTGDLLFTRKNTYDLVAASALVYSTRPKLMLSDLIFRLRLKTDSDVISEYLWALLSNDGKRKQIQSLAGGSSGSMPNISKSKLMEQMIEVPPMALQKKYAKILHSNYRIRNKLEDAFQLSNIFFNSLLQRAFKCELLLNTDVAL